MCIAIDSGLVVVEPSMLVYMSNDLILRNLFDDPYQTDIIPVYMLSLNFLAHNFVPIKTKG